MLKKDIISELNSNHLIQAAQIRSENSVYQSSDAAYAFIITGLKLLFPHIVASQFKTIITDDDKDGSIDAIYFDSKKKMVHVLDFKAGGFAYDEINKFKNDLANYLFNPRQSITGLDHKVKRGIAKIRKLIKRDWKVVVYAIRSSACMINSSTKRLLANLKSNYPRIEQYYFLNCDELVDRALKIKAKQNTYNWNVKIRHGNNVVPSDKIIVRAKRNASTKALFARINIKNILLLQKDFKTKGLDLFDKNVREFQNNKQISKKIIVSITSHGDNFYVFHNGLTFSCNQIEEVDEYNFKIINPQIINGCQTVNAIFNKYQNDLSSPYLRNASILCRFYALESSMIEKVCEATNTQTKINLSDLRSNDDVQKVFEEALFTKGIVYHRKKTKKLRDSIDITEMAQWIYACKYGKPAEAKNKKATLFDIILNNPPYYRIFNTGMELKMLVSVCKIALFVKNKIRHTSKRKWPFKKDADLHIIAGIYKLSDKNWSFDTKFKRVNKIITLVIKKLRSKYGHEISFNKIFTKMDETWKKTLQQINTL